MAETSSEHGVELDDVDRAGSRLALDVHGTSTWTFSPWRTTMRSMCSMIWRHRVLLHVLDQGELLGALDVELEERVRLDGG